MEFNYSYAEEKLLTLICGLVDQYMRKFDDNSYDHQHMTIGENVADVLERYDLAIVEGRSIEPTDKFRELLDKL